MQHVYGHTGNLANECDNHAAALGALGLTSNHNNLFTRWTHHSFDSASCFATCYNLGDVLEKLSDIRTEHVSTSQLQNRRQRFVLSPGFIVSHRACVISLVIISRSFPKPSLLQCFLVVGYVLPWKSQIRLFIPPFCRHHRVLDLLFHVQIGGIFELLVEEIDLARIALSCHFALDLLCDKAETHDSA